MKRVLESGIFVAMLALAACGDGGEPPAVPQGNFQLLMVGVRSLPVQIGDKYLDGSYDALAAGSLRFLSRGRLLVAGTTHRLNADGSQRTETVDTALFRYRFLDDVLELEFDDPLGVRQDTLEYMDYQSRQALRAISAHYARSGSPAPLLDGALYVRID